MKRQIIMILSLLLSNYCLNAQWKQTNGPLGYTDVLNIVKLDNKFLVSTENGVYKADSLGSDWKYCPNIPVFSSSSLLNGNLIIAARDQYNTFNLYKLTLQNDSLILSSFYKPPYSINDFIIWDNKIIIGMNYFGCYVSEDNGLTWNPKNNGLPKETIYRPHGEPPAYLPFVNKYSHTSTSIIALTPKGVYKTIDKGNSWNKLSLSFDYNDISAIYANNDSLYFGVKNSLFISPDNGNTWLKKLNLENNYFIKSILKINQDLLIGSDSGGIYNFNLKQELINQINTGLTIKSVNGLYLLDSIIISSVKGDGLFNKALNNSSWNQITKGLICSTPLSISIIKNNLIANDNKKLYLSKNNGMDWVDITPKYDYQLIGGVNVLQDSIIYISLSMKEYDRFKILYSTDIGKSWKILQDIDCYGYYGSGKIFSDQNSTIMMIPSDNNIFTIKDYGKTLGIAKGGGSINSVIFIPNSKVYSMGTCYNLNAYYSVYYFNTLDNNFKLDTIGIGKVAIFSMAYFKNQMYAFAECGAVFNKNENDYRWKRASDCLGFVTDYTSTQNNLYISTYSGIFFQSGNGKWFSLNDGLKNTDIRSIKCNDKYIYAGVTGRGIWYRSISDTLSKIPITTSVHSIPENAVSLFYPNPTSGILISQNSIESCNLSIYDIMGVKVFEKNLKSTTFDISFLSNGEYFLVINSDKGLFTQKIIKK